ncbi:MAG: hypothetical protein ACE5HI_17490, partial [bacterium]
RRSYLQGFVALAIGAILTISALSVMPWVYFPYDQYAVAALWVMGTGMPIILVWALVIFFGSRFIKTTATNATTCEAK